MSDSKPTTAHAHHVALSGAITAMYNILTATGSAERGLIQVEAGNYIDSQIPDGSEENRESKEYLRQTLLWEPIRQL